jgi:hypothetical protein
VATTSRSPATDLADASPSSVDRRHLRGFGFDKAIELGDAARHRRRLQGRARRLSAERPQDVERIKACSATCTTCSSASSRSAARVAQGQDHELFSGAFWSAQALELGLIDGVSDIRTKMRELHGDKVRLKVVPLERGGLLSRLRRLPSVVGYEELTRGHLAIADDLISAIETRALWSRFGL